MNLGGMCCDCRLAFMIATSMMAVCGFVGMSPNMEVTEAWSESFC
jgi:hypothetical protein